jgi:LacI family transcriptional regulator
MKVTLHDVAARSGVSIATASRALAGLPVSKANLAKVAAAARELGYVANEAARALRAERTMTMGLIFSDLRNTLGIELLDALSEAIEAAGYSLIISTARGDEARYDVLMQRFLERRVDALFCVRARGAGEMLAAYAPAGIPVLALFERAPAFADAPLLRPSFSGPAREVADHLVSLGHRRIVVVRPDPRAAALNAVAEALKGQGAEVEVAAPSEAEGMSAFLAAQMTERPRPTAIVAPDPYVRGLHIACAAAGVSLPGDLSLVAVCEAAAEAYHRRHGLSTLAIDPQRLGRASAAAMLAWLAGARPADRIKVQAGAFTARATSGVAPARVGM